MPIACWPRLLCFLGGSRAPFVFVLPQVAAKAGWPRVGPSQLRKIQARSRPNRLDGPGPSAFAFDCLHVAANCVAAAGAVMISWIPSGPPPTPLFCRTSVLLPPAAAPLSTGARGLDPTVLPAPLPQSQKVCSISIPAASRQQLASAPRNALVLHYPADARRGQRGQVCHPQECTNSPAASLASKAAMRALETVNSLKERFVKASIPSQHPNRMHICQRAAACPAPSAGRESPSIMHLHLEMFCTDSTPCRLQFPATISSDLLSKARRARQAALRLLPPHGAAHFFPSADREHC